MNSEQSNLCIKISIAYKSENKWGEKYKNCRTRKQTTHLVCKNKEDKKILCENKLCENNMTVEAKICFI